MELVRPYSGPPSGERENRLERDDKEKARNALAGDRNMDLQSVTVLNICFVRTHRDLPQVYRDASAMTSSKYFPSL
jgi:hypothetical protein